MNRNIINRSILVLSTVLFAGCASTEADTEHLSEGDPGVEALPFTWGMGDIGYPKKFIVQPGDDVEKRTRTCVIDYETEDHPSPGAQASACRKPLDEDCNEDGGIPLPGVLRRANFSGGVVESVTVTIECRFPAGEG
jgi:hypothetical protein